MEYSYLLDQADTCEDPCMRMVYACELFVSLLFSASFLIVLIKWIAILKAMEGLVKNKSD